MNLPVWTGQVIVDSKWETVKFHWNGGSIIIIDLFCVFQIMVCDENDIKMNKGTFATRDEENLWSHEKVF